MTVRTREITLAAFGDANFGDGVATVMDARGARWPWRRRRADAAQADIAFGNLECAISRRGFPVPKQFNFRGRPDRLRAGRALRRPRRAQPRQQPRRRLRDRRAARHRARRPRQRARLPVGAGATLAAARRPQVISRLGLRVAFVGFSDIGPGVVRRRPAAGPARRSPRPRGHRRRRARRAPRRRRRRRDVPLGRRARDERERAPARVRPRPRSTAGATAVIGAHPHVLQPIRRAGSGGAGSSPTASATSSGRPARR